MTSKRNRKFLLLVISYSLFVSLVPVLASAAEFPFLQSLKGPLVSCTGAPITGSNLPTCVSLCDLLKTGQNIINFMMALAVLAIGPIMIVVGGIMMLVSGGSQERFSSGRKIATGAVIGIAIALGAFIIVNTFFYFIAIGTGSAPRTGSNPGSWSNIQCAPAGANP